MRRDLDTPEGRLAAAEALGPDGYNRAMAEHRQRNVIETVNGHALRRVQSARFGALIMVGDTRTAFRTLDEARAHARATPNGGTP